MPTWPEGTDKRLATMCPNEDCGVVNLYSLTDEQAQHIADTGEATCECDDCGTCYTVCTVDVEIPAQRSHMVEEAFEDRTYSWIIKRLLNGATPDEILAIVTDEARPEVARILKDVTG